MDSRITAFVRSVACSLALVLTTTLSWAQVESAADAESTTSLATQSLLSEAATSNPAVRAAYLNWRAELERADATGKLPDPRLTYGNFVQPVETRVGPQQHQVGLSQTLPWFGSLGREQDAARASAAAAHARLHATWLDVRTQVLRALHEIHRIDGLLAIERDALDLLGQFEAVARARLRVNAMGSADLLRMQVELGRTEDRVRQLEDRRAPAVARLNALLDRPADAPFASTPSLTVAAEFASFDVLRARMVEDHPRLIALRHEVERQERLSDVARDRGRPDLTLGVVHTFVGERDDADVMDEGDDATLATLSINVPLWRGKVGAGVRAAQRQRAAHESTVRATTNELTASLREALFEHDDALRRVALYESTLVPKAEESLGATLDAYANGASSFGDLIDVEQTLLEFQRQSLGARVDRANAHARLESLVPDPAAIRTALAPLEESR